jgi:CDP-diacylglycerol--glycerol-3-phosphate 3-phosphatidyltransferase
VIDPHRPHPEEAVHADRPGDLDDHGPLTVPNALTVARMAGSGVLLWLAHAGHPSSFIALYAVLLFTDWIDGKIAIWLHQRSVLGARMDSVADAVLYTCLVIGISWLKPEFIESDTPLIWTMVGSYALSLLTGLVRFRRLPAYHTRAAKTCWLLVSIGAIALLLDGPWWPARVALVAVIITNLEATAISLVLPRWQMDVTSIWHAVRDTRRK